MGNTLSDENEIFLDKVFSLSHAAATSENPEKLIKQILSAAASLANADGTFFFSVTSAGFMNLSYTNVKSLNLTLSGTTNLTLFPSVFLPECKSKNTLQPVEICAIRQEIINSPSIYAENNLDTSLFQNFDKEHDYTTISFLGFPVLNSQNITLGVVILINAGDKNGKICPFSPSLQKKIIGLCQSISTALERKQLKESYSQLLESFINILAKAIDEKSPYTGLHCQRVPIITKMLAAAAVAETEGPLKNFEMSDNEWYALHIASWLHDCGKITTPEYIVDKATKLETPYNRIHEIRNRFEILRRDAHIEYLQKRLANTDTQQNLQAEFVSKVKELQQNFEFIGRCNTGDTSLSQADLDHLEALASIPFTRYFDRTVGLSWSEKSLIDDLKAAASPETEYLIQNRPEQLKAAYNKGELSNLKVVRGTINNDEREKINEHIVTTIDILKNLPFPAELANVIEYAGSHHERIDGKGYPNGLTGDQMSIPAKIMAIADVFEALTATDRPYKEPKKLSEVLRIMREMKNSGHLDPDLYELFIKNGVYMDYAKEYLDKKQIDDFNPDEFL